VPLDLIATELSVLELGFIMNEGSQAAPSGHSEPPVIDLGFIMNEGSQAAPSGHSEPPVLELGFIMNEGSQAAPSGHSIREAPSSLINICAETPKEYKRPISIIFFIMTISVHQMKT
jgi:hypothetical protein